MSPRQLTPLRWVPSLYFAMGAPMIAVSVVAAIMYKNLGVSNADIAFHTGFMYLPWTLKPLWAPIVEMPGAPDAAPVATGPSAARQYAAVAGQQAWRRTLSPRHQSAVKKYFEQ